MKAWYIEFAIWFRYVYALGPKHCGYALFFFMRATKLPKNLFSPFTAACSNTVAFIYSFSLGPSGPLQQRRVHLRHAFNNTDWRGGDQSDGGRQSHSVRSRLESEHGHAGGGVIFAGEQL